MKDSVEQQLSRVVTGDEAAAAWLYDTFATSLFRRLRWRYGRPNGPDPEDMVHDLFLAVFRDDCRLLREFLERSSGKLDHSSLERRLWDLACGLATNRMRSHSTTRTSQIHEDYDKVDAAPSVELQVVDRQRLTLLAACLQRGSARTFLYFKLRFRDGLAPEEIVSVTGWSKKATYKLKQKLNEGLERCSKELGWRD